jgi:long-chain acyl-CoA synthetase
MMTPPTSPTVPLPARFAHVAQLDTLPKLLRHNARQYGADTALREKELGLWQTHTWAQYEERASLWAIGLRSLGVGPGDVVAIIGDSRPDWAAAAVGVHALRAMTLGLYQDALDAEVGYLTGYAGAKVIIAEDEMQADKMLRVTKDVASVKWIVYCDARGMRKYKDPRLVSAEGLLENAAMTKEQEPELWGSLVEATSGIDPSVLCSTSGTTSNPKLAIVSSGPFIRHVAIYCDLLDLGPEDEYVSLLPMAWIGEQFQALYQPIICRHKLNFVEESDTVMSDLREIAPTFMFLAPRVWEQIAADVRAQIMDVREGLETRCRGLGQGLHQQARAMDGSACLARPARLHAAALCDNGRRRDGARYLQVLHGHGRANDAALWPDGNGRHLLHPEAGRD